MKLSLDRLWLKYFLSYKAQGIDLPDHGMVLLQGPSGAGKSAIMQGVAYAFGFNSTPANKLTTWGGEEGAAVQITGRFDKEAFTLIRSVDKPAILEIGDIQYQGNSNVKSVLQGGLGVSPEFLSELTYRPQQEPGSFVRKTDSEKKEFLTQVLGLQKFEQAVEEAQKHLQVLNVEIATYESRADNFKLAVDAANAEIEKYPCPVPMTDYSVPIAEAQEEVDAANVILAHHRFMLSKADKPEDSEEVKSSKIVLNGLQEMKIAEEKVVATMTATAKGWGGARFKLENLLKKKEKLETGTCFECGQDWVNEGALEHVVEEIKETEALVALHTEAIAKHDYAKEKIKTLDVGILDITKEIETLTTESYQNYRTLTTAVATANEEVWAAQTELDKLRSNYQIALEKYSKAKELYEGAVGRLALAQNNLEATKLTLELKDREMRTESDFVLLAGNQGFLGAIFEEVLIQIAAEANSILAQVPNTAHVAISFTTETTTQGGKQKKSITLNVSVSGNSTTLQAGLSGGMKTVVMLAIDLAVGKVVAQRSGLNPNWLILDEPFDGLDSSSREAMLEMLAKEAQEKVIIVVDHSVDTSGMFQTVYKVSQTNGISTVDTMK